MLSNASRHLRRVPTRLLVVAPLSTDAAAAAAAASLSASTLFGDTFNPSSGIVSPCATAPHEFTVGPSNGFLPLHDPLTRLPPKFDALNTLLERMPVVVPTAHGPQPGLLALGKLGDAVHTDLPEYTPSQMEDASPLVLAALYRDLTFAASAYLLEPCDLAFKATGQYGLGRKVLPANIARPLCYVADRLSAKPFMEYALSYALYNWKRKEIFRGLDYDNLETIRKLHGGASEAGFILVHVSMVAHSATLVQNVDKVVKAVEGNRREDLNVALDDFVTNLSAINVVMETMWTRSDPKEYLKLRTFIMGIKDQSMFPEGVIYEGIDDKPKFYRGESGANDSIVPTCDNLFELHFEDNPLTEILRDFRSYRPVNHNIYLQNVARRSSDARVREYCLADPTSALLYLANIDLLREFRWRHWNFTKEYIIKYSEHPVATGGSPIATWLPNQLSGVLNLMEEVAAKIEKYEKDGKKLKPDHVEQFKAIKNRSSAQLRTLNREVAELKKRYNVE